MYESPDSQYQALAAPLAALGQEHLLGFWKQLDDPQRRELLADLRSLNLAELPHLLRIVADRMSATVPDRLAPAPVTPRELVTPELVQRGRLLLESGKVAAFTVAGGQGTRLGFEGPKGALPVSPVRGRTLFQLFAESIRATTLRYGGRVRWYVMTSPQNDAQTRAFFDRHGYFGLDPAEVLFFQQGVVPTFDRRGRILLAEKNRVALSPDGHGGSLLALARSGMIEDMTRHGVEHISYFQVDNPLVYALDPAFLGLHAARGSEMSSKTVPKADDLERVGNFVLADGRLTVIEYTDLPESLAHARKPDGTRMFDAANIAIHILSRRFIERLTADPASFALPWHRAEKKVSSIDPATGHRIDPKEPNAIKLETFVFDALPLAKNPVLMATSRAEEFSPVKNATGVDSLETARRDQIRRAARWLEAAGWTIPLTPTGEPDCEVEISPLVALDEEEFISRQLPRRALGRGERLAVE